METEALPSFATLLKEYRVARGLSQEALAEKAGLSREAVSLLERGRRLSPHRDTVIVLAKTLKLSSDERARLLAAADDRHRRAAAATPLESEPPSSLPARLTSFIGRAQEMAEVQRLVVSKRLVTLVGPGGIGKTSLALAVAAAVHHQFAHGVALVELAALTDVELLPLTLASVLGIREQHGEPILTTVGRALGITQRLFVLDNCEHLLLGCARVAEELLQACPRVTILTTSREPLRIGGEAIWRVPSLSVPKNDEKSPDELMRSDAIRLFVERAGAVRPGFALTSGNGAAVAEICRRLDGIPLAIELAAARVAVLTPDQIARHLKDRFNLLSSGSRTARPRHQTLRALIDWSHDLLTTQEQLLFRRVAVFVDGFTLDAAKTVCTDGGQATGDAGAILLPLPHFPSEDTLDLVAGLVEKSLVLVEESDGEARFTMLETIRAYALDRLVASGEASVLHHRHATWYLSLAETSRPTVMSEEKLQPWLKCLDTERDNLRAALRWMRESRDVEPALRLAGALWFYWQLRDDYVEGKAQIDAVLTLPGVTNYPSALALARRGAGQMARGLGDLPKARSYLEAVVDFYRSCGDNRNLGDAVLWLGIVAQGQADYDHSVPLLEEAYAIGRQVDEPRLTAMVLFQLGLAKRELGDPIHARSLMEESIALFRSCGTTEWLTVQVISNLGLVAEDLGDQTFAASCYREALTYLGRVEDRRAIIDVLENFANLATKASQPARALRLIGGAARLREEIAWPVSPMMRGRHARTLDLARGQLALELADAELSAGRRMSLQEVVAYALEDEDGDR